MKKYSILLLLLFVFELSAQVIPPSRRVDWSIAGYQGEIPNPSNIVDVTSYGAVGDGITDDYLAIVSTVNSLGGNMGVVYFPAGSYMIKSTIDLPDSIIIRGAGSDSTTLLFDLNGVPSSCLTISKSQSNVFTAIYSGFIMGSDKILADSASMFSAGNYAELRQDNGAWDTNPATWAEHAVGQIVEITNVSGDTLFLKNPLRLTYDTSLNLEIQKIIPKYNVGVECLKIARLDSAATNSGNNIFYSYSAQCWVKGVESVNSNGAHFYISHSTQVEVRGCYLHHAFSYDGTGTSGYGALVHGGSGECLITNNIFNHLRHAMILKTGANGNVVSYNYSTDPYRWESPHDLSGDISFHGHFAYSNLLEGNIIQNIILDHFWGPAGPFNTFFRNRAEYYGIIMTTNIVLTDSQNYVGNEVTNTSSPFILGQYLLTGAGHFQHGNKIKGVVTPFGTNVLDDTSYYLNKTPIFWSVTCSWPAIGIPNIYNTGSIPAKDRYISGSNFTVCSDTLYFEGIEKNRNQFLNEIKIRPNPFNNSFTISYLPFYANSTKINIYDIFGKPVYSKTFNSINKDQSIKIYLPTSLNKGMYFVRIQSGEKIYTKKVIKI